MDKRNRNTDRSQQATEVGALISLLITAASLGLDFLSILPQVRWSLVALFAFFVFCILVWRWISSLNSELNSRTPNIQLVGRPKLDDVQMDMNIQEGTEVFHITGISHMAHAVFANNPEHITDKNSATGVRAEITYLNADKQVLFATQGRWSETDQPSEITRGKRSTIESTDFPNNGAHRTLDLLIKYPEDEHVYGYNNSSYDYPYYLHPGLEIKEPRFFIQVLLKGAYLQKVVYEFEVFTRGKNDIFEIRSDDKWLRAKSTGAQKILAKIQILEREATKKQSSRKKTSSKP